MLGLQGKHALIVHANESVRNALASLLTRNGMTAQFAASTDEALANVSRMDAPQVSLAIIDSGLQCENGDDLAARLLERTVEERPSIILLAPPNSALLRERFSHERNVAILHKPLRLTQLLATAEALAIASLRDESAQPEEPMPHMADEIPLSILLAEDNPASATITLNALSRLGYRADHVITGEDALDALKRRTYDVVLMDLHLPSLDGIETTRAIHNEITPDVRPYIIALTASASSADRNACREAGMDEYLTKPLDVVDLAFLLANLLPQDSA